MLILMRRVRVVLRVARLQTLPLIVGNLIIRIAEQVPVRQRRAKRSHLRLPTDSDTGGDISRRMQRERHGSQRASVDKYKRLDSQRQDFDQAQLAAEKRLAEPARAA